jgi:hypothetical protein
MLEEKEMETNKLIMPLLAIVVFIGVGVVFLIKGNTTLVKVLSILLIGAGAFMIQQLMVLYNKEKEVKK